MKYSRKFLVTVESDDKNNLEIIASAIDKLNIPYKPGCDACSSVEEVQVEMWWPPSGNVIN